MEQLLSFKVTEPFVVSNHDFCIYIIIMKEDNINLQRKIDQRKIDLGGAKIWRRRNPHKAGESEESLWETPIKNKQPHR